MHTAGPDQCQEARIQSTVVGKDPRPYLLPLWVCVSRTLDSGMDPDSSPGIQVRNTVTLTTVPSVLPQRFQALQVTNPFRVAVSVTKLNQ